MFFIVSFLSYRFKNEPSLDKDKDPLGLWKTKRLEYPTLTRLVKKFLCVPATSTQAEQVFSWMGWLLNKRRLCLSGESVNSQTLLEGTLDWLIFTLSTINWSISKMDLLKSEFTCFPLFNYYLSLFIFLLLSFIIYGKLPFEYTYRKESMINRLSNLINRNRSAAKISQVLCSSCITIRVFGFCFCS